MFYGYASDGKIMFASEMKALSDLCDEVKSFPPGHIYDGDKFVRFTDIAKVDRFTDDEMGTILLCLVFIISISHFIDCFFAPLQR